MHTDVTVYKYELQFASAVQFLIFDSECCYCAVISAPFCR